MKILVMYGDNLFGRTLMQRFTKEGHNIICADKETVALDKKTAVLSYALNHDHTVNEIFRIHNLEGVIFIGDTLIDGLAPYSDGEHLEEILRLAEEYKVKRFMYITQTVHEANEKFILRSHIDKYLCQEYVERDNAPVKVVEFGNIYAPEANCGIVLRMLKACELGIDWEDDSLLNLFQVNDAVDATLRIWQGAGQDSYYMVHNPHGYVRGRQLFAYIKDLFIGLDAQLEEENCKEKADFLSDVNWRPKYFLDSELPKVVSWFVNRNKPKEEQKEFSLMKDLRPYIENFVLFSIVAAISIHLQDGSSVNQYTGVDFAYVYIIIMGLLYGKGQAASAILLSSALLIHKYISQGSDLISIMYQTQPMVHMATYLFLGTMVGYITDNHNKSVERLQAQYNHLQDRFNFLYKNYTDVVGIKDVFYRQILNTSDSVGKIYNIITKLESVRREELFCAACEVVSEFLDVESVAIYTKGRSPYYLRLRVRQGPACADLDKSLKIEALPYLEKLMTSHTVFQNKKLDGKLPDMAAPIMFDDKVIAVIQVYDIPFERFSLQSEIMLKVVSLLIASAIRKAELYEESIRDKMYLVDTRIINQEHFAYHVQEATRQHELDFRNFQKARIVTFKNEVLSADAEHERLVELSSILERIIREDDLIGITGEGNIEALLFNLPDEFKDSVKGRFDKEGIDIKWIA